MKEMKSVWIFLCTPLIIFNQINVSCNLGPFYSLTVS